MSIIFFSDFDNFWYDWRAMLALVLEELRRAGVSSESLGRATKIANAKGFTFESWFILMGIKEDKLPELVQLAEYRLMQGDSFLHPGSHGVAERTAEYLKHILLTFGNPIYQKNKWRGTPEFRRHFTDARFVFNRETKGDIIASYKEDVADIVLFGDDSPGHLIDTRVKAPWARLVRMMHPDLHLKPHDWDGVKWDVVSSTHELEEWLQSHR